MNYPGKELENFDKAIFWRAYIYHQIKKFIKENVLEVGAGIGSFTKNYQNNIKHATLTEIDSKNYNILKKKFKKKKYLILNRTTKKIKKKFDTIMYLNVLEHIRDDKKELKIALSKLKKNGYLIILVPAHNNLYSKFDKAVGHFRRYEISFFHSLKFNNAKVIKCHFLDAIGYFLYFLNKLFFKKETYPSYFKIFVWDRIFTPISIFLDVLLLKKFGKNILYVLKKTK